MMHRLLRGTFAVTALGAVLLGVLGMRAPAAVEPSPMIDQGEAELIATDSADHSAALLRIAAESTPFRATGEVPVVRFGEAPPPPAPPPAPKPALSLSGILWGKEPAAIVEGIPGREGQILLRQGDTEGMLRIVRIDSATVTITGLDTTWVLRVRQPW